MPERSGCRVVDPPLAGTVSLTMAFSSDREQQSPLPLWRRKMRGDTRFPTREAADDVPSRPVRRKRTETPPQAPEIHRRTRRRAAVLTGREEMAGAMDPDHVIRELMDNWPDLEHLLVKHGAFYPLIDKVRRIRNDVAHGNGAFTRSRKVHTDAMRSIGMLEMAVRSAGTEEGRRRRREAELGVPQG